MLKSIKVIIFTFILIILLSSSVFASRTMSSVVVEMLIAINSFLMVVALAIGIIYMIKSKKSKVTRAIIGTIIIIIPAIIMWLLNVFNQNVTF